MTAFMTLAEKILSLLNSLWVNGPLIIIALLGISFLVAFHEFGHLIFAKLFNVYAPSFSIGFGPRILEKKIGETTYALSLIPLGGYVELAGSQEVGQGDQAHAHDTSDRSFAMVPYWQKLLIMLGGIGCNVLFTILAFWILFALGAPCIGTWCNERPAYIGAVIEDRAAAKATLKAGDTVTHVDNSPTKTIQAVTRALSGFINTPTTITVARGSETIQTEITVDAQESDATKPRMGVIWQVPALPLGSALAQAGTATWGLTTQITSALAGMRKNTEGLAGPIKLMQMTMQFAGMGFKMFLFILAFISLNLALFNVLPLPIFDGGQVLFFSIEALLGRPLSDSTRERIHQATWLFVIALTLFLVLKDLGWLKRIL